MPHHSIENHFAPHRTTPHHSKPHPLCSLHTTPHHIRHSRAHHSPHTTPRLRGATRNAQVLISTQHLSRDHPIISRSWQIPAGITTCLDASVFIGVSLSTQKHSSTETQPAHTSRGKVRYTQTQIHIQCVSPSSPIRKQDTILFLSVRMHTHLHTYTLSLNTCTHKTHRHSCSGRNALHSECSMRVHSANVTSVRLTFSPLLMSGVFMNTELISLDA